MNNLSNKLRILVGRFWNKLFEPFWNLYYTYGSCCPPKSYYYKKWIEDPECYEWEWEHYGEFYEPTCFPLPFKINCVGCHGCASVPNPLLTPDKPKGPWKIRTTEMFNEQYSSMFGESALVELLWDLEKHNQAVDEATR